MITDHKPEIKENSGPTPNSQLSITNYQSEENYPLSIINYQLLKALALSEGFFACGIARACPVDEQVARDYREWIAQGGHADMSYLADNIDKRLDPTLLLDGAQSIIVVALNYAPARCIPDDQYQLAAYAYGRDYHDVIKQRLRRLIANGPLSIDNCKIATDTVPILERYWAWQAGIGFIGRNHQLIIPGAGSMFFLGEIITTARFDHYDQPVANRCGTCHNCIDACPTGALGHSFDARRCLSYQTIEHRGPLDADISDLLGNSIYGCDRCQQSCPWNRFATPTDIPELQPSEALLSMTKDDWRHLTPDQYRALFKGSAVKRTKYEGLMRNIEAKREEIQRLR